MREKHLKARMKNFDDKEEEKMPERLSVDQLKMLCLYLNDPKNYKRCDKTGKIKKDKTNK